MLDKLPSQTSCLLAAFIPAGSQDWATQISQSKAATWPNTIAEERRLEVKVVDAFRSDFHAGSHEIVSQPPEVICC